MKRGFIPNRLRAGKKPPDVKGADRKIEEIVGDKFTWFDLQNPDRKDVEELAARYGFNELNIEDCMTKFELPKLDSCKACR